MTFSSIREARDEGFPCAIGRTERDVTFAIIERLAHQETEPGPEIISREMRCLIQHDFFACALIRAYDSRILRVSNMNFPSGFLDELELRPGSASCDAVHQWLSSRTPVLVQNVDRLLPPKRTGMLLSWPVPRGGLVLHGQLGSTGTRGLIFIFGNIPLPCIGKCEDALRFLTPYLFSAMARTFWSTQRTMDVRQLTAREIEVIEWMHYGKTNEEIAELLKISIYTVKNHVQKILVKLSANNRTQAVLRAIEAGIVRDDVGEGPGSNTRRHD